LKFPPLLFSIIHLIICLSIRPQKFAQKIQENVTFFDNFLKFDGEEALPKLKDTEFGLILLHIRMPGMDGMEVLRQVCEIRSDIRIITITASGTIELAFEAMKWARLILYRSGFLPKRFGNWSPGSWIEGNIIDCFLTLLTNFLRPN
jgi:CheY-like chemotaxis protein